PRMLRLRVMRLDGWLLAIALLQGCGLGTCPARKPRETSADLGWAQVHGYLEHAHLETSEQMSCDDACSSVLGVDMESVEVVACDHVLTEVIVVEPPEETGGFDILPDTGWKDSGDTDTGEPGDEERLVGHVDCTWRRRSC